MAECRSLIEFLRAFEHHRRAADATYARSKRSSSSPSSKHTHLTDLCDDHPSLSAAADALVLLAVLAALGFLIIPHITHLLHSLSTLLHPSCLSAAALAGAAAAVASALLGWHLLRHHARRCGKPRCRGLKKAVEFDIQLETEECVRGRPTPAARSSAALLAAAGACPVDLDDAHRELEVELRKMAPPNGRTVLVFRAPCGCPKGRMEVWGAKKVRRIKK